LVGTVALHEFARLEDLSDELIALAFHAVVGASRLPLTSVEAPLPAFSLGQLAYCYRANGAAGPSSTGVADFLDRAPDMGLGWLEKTKLLEAVLRAAPAGDLG